MTVSTSILQTPEAAMDDLTDIVTSLRVSAAATIINAQYEELLATEIFCHKTVPEDLNRKDAASYRKCLVDQESRDVLTAIWKESRIIPEAAFSDLPFGRVFGERELTVYNLAVEMSADKSSVAKTNSRIRMIGLSAEAYGLIERNMTSPTCRPLRGTQRLHRFMVKLSTQNHRVMSELISALTNSIEELNRH